MERLGEEIWSCERPFSLAGVGFGGRMTVMRVGGDLALHSPVAIDDALAEQLEALGDVRWLIAPNTFHHVFVGAAKERWPDAEVLAASGIERKQKTLPIARALDGEAPDAWAGAIDAHLIAGMPKLNESAFLHRASGTLVLTDFVFNFRDMESWWDRTFLSMAGAYGGMRQSKLLRFSMKDMERVKESRDTLLSWDFDSMSLCHGHMVGGGAKDALAEATRWMG